MDNDDLNSLKGKLGEHIKALRQERGFSVRQFALMAEIEHPQLINIEKGRVDMKLTTIYKIAKAFKVHPKELFAIGLNLY